MSSMPHLTSSNEDGLFARAKAGDDSAWELLVEKCYDKVRRTIRRRLRAWNEMRNLYDSCDFAGDVWKSLVAKSDRFDFPNADALTAFLRKAATQKLIDAARRLHTLKQDSDRECRLEALISGGDGGERAFDLASPDPTPSQFALAREAEEQLLAAAQSDEQRRLIERKVQGDTNKEAAEHTGLHVRAVQRYLEKLHDSWYERDAS